MVSTEARTAFLQRIHIFRDLTEDDLTLIAEKLEEQTFPEGGTLFEQGDEADRFFIIYRGKVNVSRIHRKEEQQLSYLVGGDYFGEEALIGNHIRQATLRAAEETFTFFLPRVEFDEFVKRHPKMKAAFRVSVANRRLARKMHFNWLWPDEVVYFVARKHEVLLVQSLTAPILALAVPIFLLVWFFATLSFPMIFLAGLLFVVIALWALWNAIDWGNDYYIITNQRVIWLEKVIGIYDSRQEAPLSTILSVGVETDMTGRVLDYGDVIVRTYVGRIPFSHVSHPYVAAHMVEEMWTRAKRTTSQLEKEAMRDILRQKMGLTVQTKAQPEPDEEEEEEEMEVEPIQVQRSLWTVIGANWLSDRFKLRMEDSGTITYRKHWFVLWRQTWQPFILIVLICTGMLIRLWTLFRTPGEKLFDLTKMPPVDTTMLTLPVLLLPLFLWWLYQYLDWSNDIFQVTPDQLLDLDRKPFGTEERRAAPLENILSTEYSRIGLAGYLFNFGTVEITVGGSKLAFEDVLDPASVQADIDRRRIARIEKKRQAEAAAERERMSDWLIAYHESQQELDSQDGASEPESESE